MIILIYMNEHNSPRILPIDIYQLEQKIYNFILFEISINYNYVYRYYFIVERFIYYTIDIYVPLVLTLNDMLYTGNSIQNID